MGKVWIVEVGCYEVEEQYAFATEELATEFASRYSAPQRRVQSAGVKSLEIRTELPPIALEEPTKSYILMMGTEGSKLVTDPEQIEKLNAHLMESIHTWGGPIGALPFPKTEAIANEVA